MSNIKEIKQLYELFSTMNIESIDIESPEGTISITFGNDTACNKAQIASSVSIPKKIDEPILAKKTEFSAIVIDIVSPAVGIFERSNPRTGEYYLKLRDIVKIGQIVGHVLVLGVRHDVIANISGKIIEMLVEDEQPIEYGQPIFRVEKSHEEP
ncbi:MAG: acetyl-CoA carboxylase biotin carboxyl carrier protein [Brevinema sp.]